MPQISESCWKLISWKHFLSGLGSNDFPAGIISALPPAPLRKWIETWDPFQLSAGVTGSQVEGVKQNLALQYYFGQTFLILWEYLESKDEHISYDTTKEEDILNWNKSYILLNGLMVEKLNKPWGSPFNWVFIIA